MLYFIDLNRIPMGSLFFSVLVSASFLNLPQQNNPNAPLVFFPDWTPGTVVLETDDTVACDLRFSQMVPEGLLQVLDGDHVLTLSVKDVKCFYFFDAHKDRYRKFFTLTVPLNRTLNREMFLEYVYGNDRVSILNHKTMGLPYAYMEFTPFKQPVPLNRQYLLDSRSGTLLPISEDNALSLLQDEEAVARFIKENDIRFRKLSDYVRVFEYDRSR